MVIIGIILTWLGLALYIACGTLIGITIDDYSDFEVNIASFMLFWPILLIIYTVHGLVSTFYRRELKEAEEEEK